MLMENSKLHVAHLKHFLRTTILRWPTETTRPVKASRRPLSPARMERTLGRLYSASRG